MKAMVTLTHKVTVIVEADDLDIIRDWSIENTPSEVYEQARKNGFYPAEDYDEYIEPVNAGEPHIKLD